MSGVLRAGTSQRGAALVVCLLIMAVLSLLGAAMITNSVIELKISGNQRASKVDFYAADGGSRLLTTRLSSPTDQVGNVADIDTFPQTLAPNATGDPADPNMPGYALAREGVTYTWGGPQPFDYHYRALYIKKGNPPKGYSASSFCGFYYEVDCLGNNTAVSTIDMKIGPK